MHYSLWNFKEWFDRLGIDLSYQITDPAPSISMLSFSPEASEESAWILPGYQLEDCSGFNSVMMYQNNRILFPVASPVEVNNQGNCMIRHYSEWEHTLMENIMEGTSLSELFSMMQREFPYPFALFLPSGAIHSKTQDWKISLKDAKRQQILQNALDTQSDFPVCRTFMFDLTRSFMYGTIRNGKKPIAILLSYEDSHRFSPGNITLFHFMMQVIRQYLDFHTEVTPATHPLSRWFQNAIESDGQKTLDLPDELQDLEWAETDYYQIIAIGVPGYQSPSLLSGLYYQYASLSVCCAIHQNTLLILSHYGRYLPGSPQVPFSNAFSSSDTCCGLSLSFRGLTRLHEYLLQALDALYKAQRSGVHLLRTEDQLSDHLLNRCKQIPEARSLIHPDILSLEKEDKKNNEQLLETLYMYYIQGRSSAQTSRALYIHRNTLRNRLDRIQRFLTLKLDTPEAFQQYIYSLLLCYRP